MSWREAAVGEQHARRRGVDASMEAPLTVLAELQRQGLVRHVGLSNVTPAQIAEGRRSCEIVCVQNHYSVARRNDR
jgi:pyridoxine 4-dehydrogenase